MYTSTVVLTGIRANWASTLAEGRHYCPQSSQKSCDVTFPGLSSALSDN